MWFSPFLSFLSFLVLLTGELLERCSGAANRINGQLWLSFRERAGSCVPVRAGRRHVGGGVHLDMLCNRPPLRGWSRDGASGGLWLAG